MYATYSWSISGIDLGPIITCRIISMISSKLCCCSTFHKIALDDIIIIAILSTSLFQSSPNMSYNVKVSPQKMYRTLQSDEKVIFRTKIWEGHCMLLYRIHVATSSGNNTWHNKKETRGGKKLVFCTTRWWEDEEDIIVQIFPDAAISAVSVHRLQRVVGGGGGNDHNNIISQLFTFWSQDCKTSLDAVQTDEEFGKSYQESVFLYKLSIVVSCCCWRSACRLSVWSLIIIIFFGFVHHHYHSSSCSFLSWRAPNYPYSSR